MFVTCHITFGQPGNFVGASLEVTRTIRNNKLHLTWGCSILFLKKGKGPWDRIPSFFQWLWPFFFKYCNSNHNLTSYSLFSRCFWWFFYLGVHRGTGVFSCFFSLLPPRAWLALVLASRLPSFDRKTPKHCACSADPGLLNVILNVTKDSWFPLSCLSSYQNKWSNQTFFQNDINI